VSDRRFDTFEQPLAELAASYAITVRALSAALELRDYATGGHAERVTSLGLALARRAAPELADDPQLEYGFLLHDVGKIGVPDAILLKPGPLDGPELAQMRKHPDLGRRILRDIPHLSGLACDVVRAHHERWDGGGYPLGLAGEEIPLAARIFALADTFDAMTSDRPYRGALPGSAALQEIASGAGTQFDPALVRSFLTLAQKLALAS
jgi:HD-GYP domain-containing protein (c-di-GMP phosphodiesterase class II)